MRNTLIVNSAFAALLLQLVFLDVAQVLNAENTISRWRGGCQKDHRLSLHLVVIWAKRFQKLRFDYHIYSTFKFFQFQLKAYSTVSRSTGLSRKPDTASLFDAYVRQNQRQYVDNIVRMDAQFAAVKSGHSRALDTIAMQKELVMTKLRAADDKFYVLEPLDNLSKYCLQKYTYSYTEKIGTPSSVELKLTNCDTGNFNYHAGSSRNALNNYYNVNLVNALNLCNKNNPYQSKNYTSCALQEVFKIIFLFFYIR